MRESHCCGKGKRGSIAEKGEGEIIERFPVSKASVGDR